MSTSFIGVSSSEALGYKQYYRITFDITRQVSFQAPETRLHFIYDHMQDSGALAPLSPDPVTSGDTVMVVDAWTIGDGANLSVAEAVRRLETIAANGTYQSVRSIQKLSGVSDVTGGAADRLGVTDSTNQSNAASDPLSKLGDLLAGLGTYTQLIVIGLVAYAVITLSAGLPLIPSRKRG